MKILVTGGTGVLGKRVVPKLIELGHEVGVIIRNQEKRKFVESQGATAILVDLFNKDEMIKISSDYEALFHLATAIPRKSKTKPEDWQMNTKLRTKGTEILLEVAIQNDMKFYLQEGYIGIYGHQDGKIVTEDTEIDTPVPTRFSLSDEYQIVLDSLVDMERVVLNTYEEHNLNTTILRFGIFYSHDSTNIPQIAEGDFPVVGKGDAYWSIIAVEDAADAIVATLHDYAKHAGKVYNITDDEPVQAKELLNFGAQVMGKKKASWVPAILVRFLFGKFALNYLTSSVRVCNKLAKQELNWQLKYPTYKDGIPVEIERYRSSYN